MTFRGAKVECLTHFSPGRTAWPRKGQKKKKSYLSIDKQTSVVVFFRTQVTPCWFFISTMVSGERDYPCLTFWNNHCHYILYSFVELNILNDRAQSWADFPPKKLKRNSEKFWSVKDVDIDLALKNTRVYYQALFILYTLIRS